MAIKVQNKNDIGNPYHSEETGQFVSAEYANQAGYEDIKSYDKMSNKITSDYDISSIFEEDDEDDELTQFWKQLHGEKVQKKIEEMSNQELIEEIKECYDFFTEKGLVFEGYENFFNGDLQLKCANFRQLKKLMNKYPVLQNGTKIIFDKAIFEGSSALGKAKKIGLNPVLFYDDINAHGKDFSYIEQKKKEAKVYSLCEFIALNPDSFLSYSSHKVDMKTKMQLNHCAKFEENMAASYVLTHEYGHCVIGYILEKKGVMDEIQKRIKNDYYGEFIIKNNIMDYFFSSEDIVSERTRVIYRDIRREVNNLRKDFLSFMYEAGDSESYYDASNNPWRYISEYSCRNSDEFFAEIFANLSSGSPNKIAKHFENFLKQYFE